MEQDFVGPVQEGRRRAGGGQVQADAVLVLHHPYPRERTSDAFARYRRELYGEFHLVHQEAALGGEGNGPPD